MLRSASPQHSVATYGSLDVALMDSKSIIIPQVTSFGKSPFDQAWAENEHVDPHSELMHVLQGQVEVKTRNYTILGKEGDTIYTPAGTPHRDVFAVDRAFEVYLLQFDWQGEDEMLKATDPTRLADISLSTKKLIAGNFHRLYQDFMSGSPFNYEIVSLCLLQIIYRMRQDVTMPGDIDTAEDHDIGYSRRMQIMNQAKRIIEENFNAPIRLEDIASELNISAYYLSHIFSRESGFTLSQYLRDVRMEQAAKMLEDHRLNISEVAMAVGFSDPIYFRKVFKFHFGTSPKTYRAKLIKG